MRLKKALSVVLSGMMAVCFTVSGVAVAPSTKAIAADTLTTVGGGAVSGDAVTGEAVVVNGYRNPVYNAETDTTEWDYVYYGSYPQSEVKGEELTEAITDAEYDADDIATVDGVKYKRVNVDSTTYNYKYGKDKNVPATEGEFFEWKNKREYHYFKFEPLKWRVLESSENGQLLLMTDNAIDCQNYMPREHKVSYYISELRSWLNEYNASYNEPKEDYSRGGFLKMAFTEAEEDAIVETKVITKPNYFWDSEVDGMIGAQEDITDKVYILSADEAMNKAYGFAPDAMTPSKTRQIAMTDYAFAKGGWAGSADELQGNCWWLTRSPGDHERKVALGYRDGRIYEEGYYANLIPYACVAPVCHVAADSEYVVKVTETPDEPTPTPSAPAANVIAGDVDGNGKVELADAQLALKIALKIATDDSSAADVDGNGKVDLTDAQLILKVALKILDKFPAYEGGEGLPTPTVEPTVAPTQKPEVVTEEALVMPEDKATGHIWIAGDSIAAEHAANDANHRATLGWGVIIGKYFSDDVVVHNTALSSRSSKSYIQEEQYTQIMEGMKAGDYLMISFGHNDEFPELARHTNPYGSSSDEGSYKWYLKNYYIDPALKKGAIPVLVSSVVERNFVGDEFMYQFHSVYKTAMEELVAEYAEKGIKLPYIDLHSQMNALYKELGKYDTELLHAKYQSKDSDDNFIQVMDNTHFTLAGARYAVKFITNGLKELNMDIMKYANEEMLASLNSIATPEKFNINDLNEWITKGQE